MQSDIIDSIRRDLKQQADDRTKESAQRFFKETIVYYGVKSVVVGKITRERFREVRDLSAPEILELCEELLKSDYLEEAFIAADWAYRMRDKFIPDHFQVFEKWIENYINNWAKCDTLCNHAVGAFIEKYPQHIAGLKLWARSPNRWMRRASAVTLIIPAKEGKFLPDILEIADILLLDGDDMVQKGYGWLLKEAARQHQDRVFDYIMNHRSDMPRTALRYAIEKMPAELRKQAMEKVKRDII